MVSKCPPWRAHISFSDTWASGRCSQFAIFSLQFSAYFTNCLLIRFVISLGYLNLADYAKSTLEKTRDSDNQVSTARYFLTQPNKAHRLRCPHTLSQIANAQKNAHRWWPFVTPSKAGVLFFSGRAPYTVLYSVYRPFRPRDTLFRKSILILTKQAVLHWFCTGCDRCSAKQCSALHRKHRHSQTCLGPSTDTFYLFRNIIQNIYLFSKGFEFCIANLAVN